MKCLAIDDEPLALNVIEEFCSKIEYLELVKKCENAIDAIQVINKHPVDLIFLDIHMPHVSGLEFIKTLPNPPLVIFTTAYSEYALQGYELSAIDYLLKPIPFERFLKAVNKAYEIYNLRSVSNQSKTDVTDHKESTDNAADFMLIKVEYSTVRVNYADIIYIEGLKDYVKIYTTGKMRMTKSTLKNLEAKLPESLFIRVHKSYIVSYSHINKVENNRIVISEKRIPIGDQYKERFYQFINKNRI